MSDATASVLPDSLASIRDEFLELPEADRLQLLLEFANALPEVPDDDVAAHPEMYERVAECQSPVYIYVELRDGAVTMHATAPAEAPTTRGFASVLAQGLAGLAPETVLTIPDDFPQSIGLTRVVSPLRISGMTGMLLRAKRQVRERLSAA